MTAFDRAVLFVLGQEGVYSDDARDPGGETKWGIARAMHPEITAEAWARWTRADAVALYRADYWTAVQGDALPPGLGLAAFDAAVNPGPSAAVRFLQQALGVPVDGVIGPRTLAAARSALPRTVAADLLARRVVYWASRPTWSRFALGWSRRTLAAYQAVIDLT